MRIDVDLHRRTECEVHFVPSLWRRLLCRAETRSRWAHIDGALWIWDDTKRICEVEVLEEIWRQALMDRAARRG